MLAIIGPLPRGGDYEETRAKKRLENLKTLREDAEKALTTYAWVDKNKGVARIPITRAMELTVAELAQKKPVPAGPIATPPAQASPTAAPNASGVSASPAPAGSPQPSAGQAQGAAVSSPPQPTGQTSSPVVASPAPASAAPAKTP